MDEQTLATRLRADKLEFWNVRSSYDSTARELARYISPRMGQFDTSETNRGEKKHQYIYDSTATGALDILTSGLASGLTNQTQRWLKLQTSNAELNEQHAVKVWLEEAGDRLLEVFNDSNTYSSLSRIYGELGLFGTACCVLEPDDEDVIHLYPLTWGQYGLATDDKGKVNRMIREFEMSTQQMVGKFGLNAVSDRVRDQAKRKNWNAKWKVYHAVEPRELDDRDTTKLDGKNMPWRSVYFEAAKGDETVLLESGYPEFPVLAPRWKLVGNNVWGDSPAYDALGPCKRLQSMTRTEGRAAALQAEPPLQGPDMKDDELERGPNGYTTVTSGQEIKPLYDSRAKLEPIDVLLQRVQGEINARMYRPLFSVMTDAQDEMTATQVRAITGERMAQLGPTVGRLDRELLSRMVDLTLGHMFDKGLLPPTPPEMEGLDIKPEMLGVLAQAQRSSGASASDQLQMKIQSHAQIDPSVAMLVDYEYDIRTYADTVGADPRILVSPAKYAEKLEAQAKAQAAQAQSQVVAEQAGAAKDMAAAEATAGA